VSFSHLQEVINAFADKDVGEGATDEEVAIAEAALGATFSGSYKAFLLSYGWARFAHEKLYGLGADVPGYLELVKNTIVERNAMRPSLPPHLIPIMNDGGGNHYCLDSTQLHDGESPIVFWDHDLGEEQAPEFVSPSFEAWLIELLSGLRERR
jgi:cell wall assembly regulator SMI1